MKTSTVSNTARVHRLDFTRVLRPRSIAIVGASADPRSFGGFVLGNLERFGYSGDLYAVSRSSTDINGRPCVKSIDELPEGLDLAVLAIPEAGVLDAVRELGQRRCHAAVLFASGYAEAGPQGQSRQQALAQAAQEAQLAIIGPNCMGFTNLMDGIPVTFEPLNARPKETRAGLAVIAQSGFMAANLRDSLIARGLPVAAIFSTGNEAGVTLEDALEWFVNADQIRAITVYAEQIRRPARFLELSRRARHIGKPIILLMPGRSARAREAAASHTGALAGDHATAVACLQREAVACVDTLDELLDVSAILACHPKPPIGGTAFMTGSGAMKNVALDLADALALPLPTLSPATAQALRAKLPDFAVAENPLDYTTIGVRQPGLIGELLLTLQSDPAIGNLALAIPVGPSVAQRDKAEHIVPALARATKPTLLVLTGDGSPIEPFFEDAIRISGVPLFRSTDRALRALRCVSDLAEALERADRADANTRITDHALPPGLPPNGIYAEHVGKAWLSEAGLPVPRNAMAHSPDEAVNIARTIGYPVVLKAQASALPHKSDAGGVFVNLADDDALRAAWSAVHANIKRHAPHLVLDGMLVESMARRGLELVVGGRRDAQWGPVVMVGLGGIWIEALKDVRLFAADTTEADIVTELGRLRAAAVLTGIRGEMAIDLQAVARVAALVGALMRANPSITEIDINPLVSYPAGQTPAVLALDALVVVKH